jgi:hypothetical protein
MTIGRKTLLRRTCPRCGRSGTVYVVERENATASFDIVWDGPSRGRLHGLHDGEHDEDWCVTLAELFGEIFGCGFDSPKEITAAEHLKVVFELKERT